MSPWALVYYPSTDVFDSWHLFIMLKIVTLRNRFVHIRRMENPMCEQLILRLVQAVLGF